MPLSTTKRWLQRLRLDGDMASRNIGRPRGEEDVLCVLSLHVSSRISRIDRDVVRFVRGFSVVEHMMVTGTILKGPIPNRQEARKGAHSGFDVTQKAQGQVRHPVFSPL